MRFSLFSFLALVLSLSVAAQDDDDNNDNNSHNGPPTFVEPSGGFGGNSGSTCNIDWNADTTGDWTNVRIDLMTGPDHLRRAIYNVGTNIDASKDTSRSHTCPDVDTSAEIYFYRMTRQDTKDGESSRTYSGRFCISNGGNCETPASGWGRGYILNSPLGEFHQNPNSAFQ